MLVLDLEKAQHALSKQCLVHGCHHRWRCKTAELLLPDTTSATYASFHSGLLPRSPEAGLQQAKGSRVHVCKGMNQNIADT